MAWVAALVARVRSVGMGESATSPPRLWLVRHGETEWSASGRHTSRTDVDLTADGAAAAHALRGRLAGNRFARVVTSPRRRARRTAALAGFDGAEVLDDLAEWDYGTDEGLTTPQIREEIPGWTVWTHGPRDGETAEQVTARADRVVAAVRAGAGDVLAFSHGHQCRVLAARWIGQPVALGAHLELATASVSVLGWERETPTLERWNETAAPDG